jgi:TRAP-type C4-dicarboxylate transport system permease large subunit
MAQTSDAARPEGLNIARSPGAALARGGWLPVAGGLAGGIVAAGAAGTSTKTIFLGAVWAGMVVGTLLVLLASYLAVRHARSAVPGPVLRQLWFQVLRRTVGWALGAYVFWFLIIEPLLGHAGIYVPMFP